MYSKEEEIIFDINKLPTKTARALERYVKSKLQGPYKKRQRA